MKTNLYKRLLTYLKGYRITLVFVIIFSVVSAIFSVLAPSVAGGITTALYDGVKTGIFNWNLIFYLLSALISIYIISQFFSYLQNFAMSKITAKFVQRLRNDVDRKMHNMKLKYYDTKTHGEILSVITNDIDTVYNVIRQNITQVLTHITTAIGILVMMIRINIWLTLIVIIIVPLSMMSASGLMKSSAKYFKKQQEQIGKLNGFIEEIYNGQSVVQTYNYQERAGRDFDALNNELQKTAQKAETISGLIRPLVSLVNNLGYVLTAILGCLFVIKGKIPVGNVQAMLQYTKQFSQPFTSIASISGSFGSALAATNRIFELLDAEEEIPDTINVKTPEMRGGSVEFSHVSFGYTEDKLLMKDVNISVKPGQKVAIVGPTGAGKTTLINLLMRFYEINSGAIIVDGVNIKDMTRKELRSRFGMVLQDTWLFDGTIMENLSYGRESIVEEEIIKASKAASADNFIRTLPGAYNMMLTNGAENISQGEKQLLTIARAMASNPEIMILDEATSNVDTHTEQKIQLAMAELMKGRTSFVIAHRLSTIKDADMILYMENGDIKEVGNHDELIALNGKYKKLYDSQFS